ncbi:MAG: STAS domain-containing protein [Mycobacterium sp.]
MATAFRYGNPAVQCGGAQVRSQCRQLATVVAVTGAVTVENIDLLTRQVTRSIIREKPYVLDLTGVTSFTAEALSLLAAVDDTCRRTADEWLVIPSQSVARVMRLNACQFATTASVPDALQCFSDTMTERRQLLPLLAKSA